MGITGHDATAITLWQLCDSLPGRTAGSGDGLLHLAAARCVTPPPAGGPAVPALQNRNPHVMGRIAPPAFNPAQDTRDDAE